MNSIKACLGDKVSPKPASATKKMCHSKPREKKGELQKECGIEIVPKLNFKQNVFFKFLIVNNIC